MPRFISGKLSEKAIKNNMDAVDFLLANNDMFKLDKAEYIVNKVEKDEIGIQHFRTSLASDGIPVYGAELVLHTDKLGFPTAAAYGPITSGTTYNSYYANGQLIIENFAPPVIGDAPVAAPSDSIDIEKAPKDSSPNPR